MLYFNKKLKKKGEEIAVWALLRLIKSEHLSRTWVVVFFKKSFPGDSKVKSRARTSGSTPFLVIPSFRDGLKHEWV